VEEEQQEEQQEEQEEEEQQEEQEEGNNCILPRGHRRIGTLQTSLVQYPQPEPSIRSPFQSW